MAKDYPGTTLMVEGGASIISSFLNSGRVDSLIVTVAPTLVGEDGVAANGAGNNVSLSLTTRLAR